MKAESLAMAVCIPGKHPAGWVSAHGQSLVMGGSGTGCLGGGPQAGYG